MKPIPILIALLLAPPAVLHAAERTILFVDDEDVLYRSGTEKKVEPLRKYEGNPVIAPDKPWEGMIGWVSVYRNPATGKCQMWYQAYNEKRAEDKRLKCVAAYAESADGKTWVKPNLGLFPYYEVKDTNIVLIGAPNAYGDRYCNSVLVDSRDPDPARRYKMVYYDWEPDDERNLGAGMRVAFSPDGVHWTKHEGMVHRTSYGAKGRQVPFADESIYVESPGKDGRPRKSWLLPLSMSDAQDVFYDGLKGCYASYGKMWMQGPDGGTHWKHGMGRIESRDFVHWSKPQFILGVSDNDPPQVEFHTSPVFLYNGQYFSLNQILNRSAGVMDIELMTSRDGFAWDRPYAGVHFLERGKGAAFDAATLLTNGTPLLVGDEMWFYYGGYRGAAVGGVGLDRQVIGAKDYFSGVGLAVMKKDRFVAIVPDPEISLRNSRKVSRDTVGKEAPKPARPNTIGQVTLRPLDLTNVRRITINADATKGRIALEVLNEDSTARRLNVHPRPQSDGARPPGPAPTYHRPVRSSRSSRSISNSCSTATCEYRSWRVNRPRRASVGDMLNAVSARTRPPSPAKLLITPRKRGARSR
jgi:hypothetical protein